MPVWPGGSHGVASEKGRLRAALLEAGDVEGLSGPQAPARATRS